MPSPFISATDVVAGEDAALHILNNPDSFGSEDEEDGDDTVPAMVDEDPDVLTATAPMMFAGTLAADDESIPEDRPPEDGDTTPTSSDEETVSGDVDGLDSVDGPGVVEVFAGTEDVVLAPPDRFGNVDDPGAVLTDAAGPGLMFVGAKNPPGNAGVATPAFPGGFLLAGFIVGSGRLRPGDPLGAGGFGCLSS